MCSANVQNEPPYDPPTPTRPRTYVLSGTRKVEAGTGRGSVALATLGDMLSDAEARLEEASEFDTYLTTSTWIAALRAARDAVAKAEAEYADGTVRG